jgi:hypothetical protein
MSSSAELYEWRDLYRGAEISARYQGWLHFAFTTVGSLAAIAYCASRLHNVVAFEWALLPIFFLISNFGEYLGHRGPMHHRRERLAIIFKRHTLHHHHFFTSEAMECESTRDFAIVLFPPVMLLFFMGGMALPIGALFYFLVSPNAGWLFAIEGISYFLLYEWLHFTYHQSPNGPIGRLAFVAALRRHHQAHHDPALMGDWNFNITFPIADWIMGTIYRGGRGTQ